MPQDQLTIEEVKEIIGTLEIMKFKMSKEFQSLLMEKDNIIKALNDSEKINPQSESFLKSKIKELEKKSEKDDLEILLFNEKLKELKKMNDESEASLKSEIKDLEKELKEYKLKK